MGSHGDNIYTTTAQKSCSYRLLTLTLSFNDAALDKTKDLNNKIKRIWFCDNATQPFFQLWKFVCNDLLI